MTLLSSLVPNTNVLKVADSNATPNASIKEVAFTSLSAPRTLTLALASTTNIATVIAVIDESGLCSQVNTITIVPQGSDLINGLSSYVLSIPYGTVTLESNGVNGWFTLTSAAPSAITRGRALALSIRN